LRKIAEQKYEAKLSVKIHVAVFSLVNTLLLIINYLTLPSFLWVVFPFFGWLIGLAVHVVAYILYAKGVYPMAKRAAIFTLTIYITVVLLLLVINYITIKKITWAIYPALFMGVGIITFIVIYLLFFKSKLTPEGEVITRKQKAVEKEMEKLKKKMSHKGTS
jgi:hypothetical protein